mgnify:CR=1 FL=1
MKAVGIILIVVGILMMVFTGFNFEKEKSLVEIGDLEVTTTEKEHVNWSTYAGGAVMLVGVVITVIGFKDERKVL